MLKNRVLMMVIYWSLTSLLIFLSALTGVATAQNSVPVINQPLVPDAVKPGGTGFTLTVNGSGFVSGSVVRWNGTTRTRVRDFKVMLAPGAPPNNPQICHSSGSTGGQ